MLKGKVIDCKSCKNEGCLIKKCAPNYINLISEKKNQLIVKKNQHIFHEGGPVFGIFFIQHGKVKVVSSNFEEKEQIVRLAGDGHILGHRGYGGETYPIGAVALEESRICFLDNNVLYDAFKANFYFLYNTMMFYSKELRKSQQRTKHFAQMTVEEKVTFALVYITETFGLNSEKKGLIANLSRQEIAEIAGTNANQVSRTITSLKKMNYIKTRGNKIFVKNYDGIKKCISNHLIDSFL